MKLLFSFKTLYFNKYENFFALFIRVSESPEFKTIKDLENYLMNHQLDGKSLFFLEPIGHLKCTYQGRAGSVIFFGYSKESPNQEKWSKIKKHLCSDLFFDNDLNLNSDVESLSTLEYSSDISRILGREY